VKLLFITVVALAGLFAAGCKDAKPNAAGPSSSPPAAAAAPATPYLPHAQPRLQTVKLYVGQEELSTELALKSVEIYTGMMWRTNMPENEAMLFVFPVPEPRAFYMRNTYVPLSLAYIDPEGIIQEIHDLQPLNETSVPSQAANIQFVLEVPQGWFQRHKISPGAVVRSQFGDLKSMFTYRPPPK
jgi:uncharacterized membrane protein (UPF0127 family)